MTIRERLLAASRKPRTATVEIPEWDGVQVTVRGLTAREYFLHVRGQSQARLSGEQELKSMAQTVALCLLDEDGSQMFVGEDAKLVDDWPVSVLQLLFNAVAKLSKLTEDDSAKNSETPQLNGSATG